LTVENDRYGMQPLYYFVRRGEICVAPRIATLMERGAPRDLDEEALAVFMHLGYFVGEDTPFLAIRSVPPDAEFRWTPGEFVVRDRRPAAAELQIQRNEAIDTYSHLFAEAIRKRPAGENAGVLLSGGRDSRHILFELCRRGTPPSLTITLDLPGNNDGEIARALARMVSVPHRLIPAQVESIAAERTKNLETNFCADEHAWILPLRDDIRGEIPELYDGIAGDVLSAGLFLDAPLLRSFREEEPDQVARRLISRAQTAAFVQRLLAGHAKERFSMVRAVGRLAVEIERHLAAPNPVGSFMFWNRTRREIGLSPFSIFSDFRVFAPYLDHDLFDFLAGLPSQLLLDRTLHDETIEGAYPRWAAQPYAKKRRAPVTPAHLAQAWSLARSLVSAPVSNLRRRTLLPRALKAGIDTRYNADMLRTLRHQITYWHQLEEIASGK
jgi:asparagine synthase (glutamine-hydrolysing)